MKWQFFLDEIYGWILFLLIRGFKVTRSKMPFQSHNVTNILFEQNLQSLHHV